MAEPRGRPSKLRDTEYAKMVAVMFVDGMSARQMAADLGVSQWTINQWRRDPRIKAHTTKLIQDRILQITRKTDAEIQRRLENAEKLSTKEILAIRSEFLGGKLRDKTEDVDDETVSEAMKAIEENPQLVDQFLEVLKRRPPAEPEGGLIIDPIEGISDDLLADEE
jgi:transposase